VRFVLRDEHDIDNPQRDLDLDDFYVSSQSDAEDIIGVVGSVLTLLLSSIAAISLVVGGIGIMNIMLVSVTERTREIGLRKAIGATRKEIMQQFLAEAVLLTLTGGIIGVLGGIIASTFIALVAKQFLSDWSLHIPINAIVLGVIVATVVGIAFGVYPAKRAANLDPIEALRYE
jgi:putative ABC transport system permease protein